MCVFLSDKFEINILCLVTTLHCLIPFLPMASMNKNNNDKWQSVKCIYVYQLNRNKRRNLLSIVIDDTTIITSVQLLISHRRVYVCFPCLVWFKQNCQPLCVCVCVVWLHAPVVRFFLLLLLPWNVFLLSMHRNGVVLSHA
jgi:hypothetical protein